MKTGLSLTALAQEIERRSAAKQDFIAPTGKMEMVVRNDKPELALHNGEVKSYAVNSVAHGQIAEYAGIPKAYYDRMVTEDPVLLATNVNRWLHDEAKKGEKRMVRTLDGNVRALLSNKFRPLENEDLAEAVLPALLQSRFMVLSADITETRLYIKAVHSDIERDVPTGRKMGDGTHTIFDTVQPQITISNSEVGFGALSIESGIFTRACTNMATFGSNLRKYHTGARAAVSDDVYALLTDSTKQLTDQAVWSQVRDIVAATLDEATLDARVKKLGEAAQQKLDGDVIEVVTRVGKKFNLAEGERKGILARLIEGGDLSRYGLHAAVTRFSADVAEYDRATELERVGGQIIELAPSQWSEVIKEAA
jgi:hypothetical protein